MVFLGSPGIQDDQLIAVFNPLVQVVCGDFGHMVHHFLHLAEVLAGDVHAPFRGQVVAGPAVGAAFQEKNVGIAQIIQGCGGQLGAASVVVADDYPRPFERHGTFDDVFDAPARYQGSVGNVRGVVLARLPDVDQREGRFPVQQFFQVMGGNFLGHRCSLRSF